MGPVSMELMRRRKLTFSAMLKSEGPEASFDTCVRWCCKRATAYAVISAGKSQQNQRGGRKTVMNLSFSNSRMRDHGLLRYDRFKARKSALQDPFQRT